MALVTRYFSTAAAGTGDGTSWANRAALFADGAWSGVITGFNFSGTDGLECRIGPGSYTVTTGLATGAFANPPSLLNPLILHGADNAGNLLQPPDPGWTSDRPAWSDATLPTITVVGNTFIAGILAVSLCRLLKLTSAGRLGPLVYVPCDWCIVDNQASNAAVVGVQSDTVSNSVLRCTGSAFAAVCGNTSANRIVNTRFEGSATATSGTRYGITQAPTSGSSGMIVQCCIVNCPGAGVSLQTSSASSRVVMDRLTIASCGTGVLGHANANPSATTSRLSRTIITGCAVGVDGVNGNLTIENCRLRGNGANYQNLSNQPAYDLIETAGSDAAEYADAAGGDYRIRSAASFAGRGIGVSQQAAAGAQLPIGRVR